MRNWLKTLDYKRLLRNGLIIGAFFLIGTIAITIAPNSRDPLTDEINLMSGFEAVIAPFGGVLGLGALVAAAGVLHYGFEKAHSRKDAALATAGVLVLLVLAGLIGFAWMPAPQLSDLWVLAALVPYVSTVLAVTPRLTSSKTEAEAKQPMERKLVPVVESTSPLYKAASTPA